MTEQPEVLIDDHTKAPRLSWKALVIIIATVASMVGSWVLASARVSAMSDRLEEIDQRGSAGLAAHISLTKDELNELRLGQMETRKDIQAMREMLEYRLAVIEGRLAIRGMPQRTAASSGPRYDSADQRPK